MQQSSNQSYRSNESYRHINHIVTTTKCFQCPFNHNKFIACRTHFRPLFTRTKALANSRHLLCTHRFRAAYRFSIPQLTGRLAFLPDAWMATSLSTLCTIWSALASQHRPPGNRIRPHTSSSMRIAYYCAAPDALQLWRWRHLFARSPDRSGENVREQRTQPATTNCTLLGTYSTRSSINIACKWQINMVIISWLVWLVFP